MSQTVQRAIVILEEISGGPKTVAELAERLSVSKSTAFRLLQTLDQAGFVYRSEDSSRWTIGNRLISIAERALDSFDLRVFASPHLRRLEQLCGHTIHLAQLLDDEVVYIDKVEGRDSVQMYSRIGKKVEAHASGIGKAILAFVEEPLREELISQLVFQRHSPTTITDRSQFRAELDEIRRQGWARDDGEFEELINCIAAPVRSGNGRVRAALSITTLKVVSPLQSLERLVPDLLKAAEDISRDAGWRSPHPSVRGAV
jgi:DNA-binding IclR family transcriptional regulator